MNSKMVFFIVYAAAAAAAAVLTMGNLCLSNLYIVQVHEVSRTHIFNTYIHSDAETNSLIFRLDFCVS